MKIGGGNPRSAAMIYVKIEGIDGGASLEKYDKWIAADTLSWGVGRQISTPVGRSGDRTRGAATIGEITFTKVHDIATPKIFKESVGGKGKKVDIHLLTTDDKGK